MVIKAVVNVTTVAVGYEHACERKRENVYEIFLDEGTEKALLKTY